MDEAKVAKAAAGFTPAQVRKALRLIAENRVRETGFAGEYIVTGSEGDHYLCSPRVCQCRGSRRVTGSGGVSACYHQLAVRLYQAATGKAA
jgi:hypothetical protein